MSKNHTKIIAEVGSNFDGELEIAREYVRACHEIGADAVKFQTLRKERLIAPEVQQNGDWKKNPAWDNFMNEELPDEWHYELKSQAEELGIEFMSTPFYLEAVDLLEDVGVSTYKIGSGDVTYYPLLKKIGATGKTVILSTGASSMEEVKKAKRTLEDAGAKKVSVLHCVANYPPHFDEMNLRAIKTLTGELGCAVGISDHSPGDLVPLASVGLGATIIEKHVTFDRANDGPDHPFAMEIDEFETMVDKVRKLERALGDGEKKPSERERDRRHNFRRSRYDPETSRPTDAEDAIWLRPQVTTD